LVWGGFPSPSAPVPETNATKSKPNAEYAAHLAYRNLLGEVIDFDTIHGLAMELAGAIEPSSDKELALATALFIFEREELHEALRPVQKMARLTMVNWLQEGTVQPGSARHFEGRLYSVFRS
jgi:hypothetical protein